MPRFKHVIECDYSPTFRAEKVASMFDVPVADKLRKEWDVDIPIEDRPWRIGLIVGASGSGKTTLARRLFGDDMHQGFYWNGRTVLDDFPQGCNLKDITETLSKVGFSSPPSWLLPYAVLSNGQKFRAELARCLLNRRDLTVFDEFTSVVDRQVAQFGSFALQKTVRRQPNGQFVAVTCHYDVEPWLEPDWVFDVSANHFQWGSLRRPPLTLEIRRVSYSAWDLFKEHHYLTADISKAAVCFCGFLDGRPVVFDAWLPFVGRLKDTRKARRGHRTVCLPDFQGMGLGNVLFTQISRMWAGLGYRVFSGTGHPAEIKKRISSGNWKMTRQGRTSGGHGGALATAKLAQGKKWNHASDRLTCGFEWIGDKMSVSEANALLNG